MRCIVTSLTDENSTELAEVTGMIQNFFLLPVVNCKHEVALHVQNCLFCAMLSFVRTWFSKVGVYSNWAMTRCTFLLFMTNNIFSCCAV